MPVRIRLQRHGKKGAPFFHIVVADGRAPRDGKFIEKLGTYNPTKNPAIIDIDIEKSVQWMRNGAQPSDTVRNILSLKGAMLKHHLLKGVDKGALTAEQAEAKFQAWVSDKENKIAKVAGSAAETARSEQKARMEAEAKVKEAKLAATEQKKKEAQAALAAAQAPEEAVAPTEEVASTEEAATEETPAAE